MDQGRQLLPRDVDVAIEAAIEQSSEEWDKFVSHNMAGPDAPEQCAGYPLAVKYMPTARARQYLKANSGLYIGSDYSFTWGKAVYVTGINEPLSTALYGRVGVVTWFDPQDPVDWRVFDARDRRNQTTFLRWLQLQTDYSPALLTVHSHYYLYLMRNIFRSQFRIDVVMCSPDEVDAQHRYTGAKDTWLAVSDWRGPGDLKGGDTEKTGNNYSDRFHDVHLVIVPEEEFVADNPALTRSPQFALRDHEKTTPLPMSQITQDARDAYFTAIDPSSGPRKFVRVAS
ncbi:hypothetical protein FHT44_006313 [Mycolicibacterium sp. BK634]|uniref:hypothetical protein n=1 Tax=Mycolicibacterium sp. BK634 TaxID=2587099 RepID=UPI0016085396|nr:hypothetical protein [Mycolicibacterium sp. BK634]MBB3753791.1 hypothetical protein [Mycolicibacterium sp. BK634]